MTIEELLIPIPSDDNRGIATLMIMWTGSDYVTVEGEKGFEHASGDVVMSSRN